MQTTKPDDSLIQLNTIVWYLFVQFELHNKQTCTCW